MSWCPGPEPYHATRLDPVSACVKNVECYDGRRAPLAVMMRCQMAGGRKDGLVAEKSLGGIA